jgi:hypothetical protein
MGYEVFANSNTRIVGSNPTHGMDVCVCVYSACVGLAKPWSPVQGQLPTVLGLRNWSETKRFKDAPKFEQHERGGGGEIRGQETEQRE